MVRGTQVTLKVKSTGAIPDLPSKTRDEIVKIMREAATNAIRHGHAQRLVVSVDASPGRLMATIEDNGTGFDPKQTRLGTHGLQGMLERARALAALSIGNCLPVVPTGAPKSSSPYPSKTLTLRRTDDQQNHRPSG